MKIPAFLSVWSLTRIGLHGLFLQIGLLYQVLHFDFKPRYYYNSGSVFKKAVAAAGTTSIATQLSDASSYWMKTTGNYDQIDTTSAPVTKILAAYDAAKKQYDTDNPQAMNNFANNLIGLLSEVVSSADASVDSEVAKYFDASNPPVSLNYLQTGDVLNAWDDGYQGQGMVVAVIDNGLESHTDLKLSDDSTAAITEADAQADIAELGYGEYISSKIPFAYDYSDNDDEATNSYSVDHGEHVAGIIAANGDVPAGTTGILSGLLGAFTGTIDTATISDMMASASPTMLRALLSVMTNQETLNKLHDVMDGMSDTDVENLGAYVVKMVTPKADTSSTSTKTSTNSDDADAGLKTFTNLLKLPTATLKMMLKGATQGVDKSTVDTGTLSTVTNILKKVRDGQLSQTMVEMIGQTAEKYLDQTGTDADSETSASKTTQGTSATASLTNKVTDNDYSVGVAPEAQILDMRVISSGQVQEAQTMERAIKDAVKLGADVINMSLGGAYTNNDAENIFEEAVKYATDHGVFVAISAANSGERANVGAAGGEDYQPEIAQTVTNPGTSPSATTVAAEGDMSIDGAMKSMFGNIASEVAYFSSWGPQSDFTLKPDVTAPGVSLQSTKYNDQYQSMSGTSMASPFIAGSAALVSQRLQKLGFTGEQLTEYTKLALMNSAVPLTDVAYNNAIISPRHQGAGQVDDGAAVKMTVAASTTEKDGNVTGSASLYNVGQSTDFNLNFTNYGDHDVTYTYKPNEGGVYTSVYDTDENGNLTGTGYSHDVLLDGASVSTDTASFTVKAGQSLTIKMTLKFDDSVAKDQIAEGFLYFNSDEDDGINNVVLPYLAFYGDLTHEQVLDEITDAGVKSYLENESGLPLGLGANDDAVKVLVANGDENFANGGSTNDSTTEITGAVEDADASKVAISPNGDGESDSADPIVYSSQNLESATAEITDANGNILRTLDVENNLDASWVNEIQGGESQDFSDIATSYSMISHSKAFAWDGKLYDQATGQYKAASDGQYEYKLTVTLEVDGEDKEQTITFPVTVDTKAPTITGAAYDASTDTLAFDYADEGIGFTTYSNTTLTIAGKDYQIGLGNDGKSNTGNFSYTLTSAQQTALQAGDGDITITLGDAASNNGTASVTTGLGTNQLPTTTADGENETAPTFQFYLPKFSAASTADGAELALNEVNTIGFKDYGFAMDSYTTPYGRVNTDTATLKAHVANYTSDTQYFVRDLVTGDVYTATAAPDANGDVYFNVDNISQAIAQMPNMLSAIFVGYAISPTAEAGVFKQSLKDSIALMWSTADAKMSGDHINDTGTLSPFTDPTDLAAAYSGDNEGAKYLFDLNDSNDGQEDSTYTINEVAKWNYDAAHNTVAKGHTIDTNHTHANIHAAAGSSADYSTPKQDVVTLDNAKLGGYTFLNTDSDNDSFDAATGEYTITGKLDLTHSDLEDSDLNGVAFYILGNSTDEDDPANKVSVDADGNFSYQIKLDKNENRAVATLLVYQIKHADGTFGEVRAYRNAIEFVTDQTDPTLNVAGLTDLKQDADGNYLLTTDQDTYTLDAGISDNADDYTLTVNGNLVFRQKVGGEPYLMNDGDNYADGNFTETFALKNGTNFITVVGTDSSGNAVTKVLKITRVDATSTVTDNGTSTTGTTSDEAAAGYAEGYRQGSTGAQLQDLAGQTPEFLTGFTAGYNAGTAARNAKLATQFSQAQTPAKAKTLSFKATKAAPQQPAASQPAASKTKQTTADALPQAGEQQSSVLGVVGAAILATLGSALGFGKRRNRN